MRLRYNNQFGTLATVGTDVTNSLVSPNINFAVAPNFATIVAPDYIPLVLDAGKAGMEIVWLTAYTAGATSGTGTRAAEDATNWPAATHAAGTWACDFTAYDTTLFAPVTEPIALTKVTSLTRATVVTSTPGSPVAANSLIPVDSTAGPVNIPLPVAPADKTLMAIKHVTQGATNAVTFSCGGSDVFNVTGGVTSKSLPLLNQSALLEYTATGAIWTVISDALTLTSLDLRYLAAPTLARRTCQSFTDPGNGGTTSYQDANMRFGFMLPVLPTRMRVKWANSELSINAKLAGAVALTGVWMGQPNIAAEIQWLGDFVSAPTQVASAFVTNSLGDEWVSSWFTPPAGFTANTPQAISIGINSAASGPAGVNSTLGLGYCEGIMCYGTNASLAANAGAAAWNAAAVTVITHTVLGDFRLEYEFVGTNPIGFWAGDSIMAGWIATASGENVAGATNFTNSSKGMCGPFNRYAEKAANRLGHLATNAAVGGTSAGSFYNLFANASNMAFTRFDLATTPPDYAFLALGTNDSVAWGVPVATFQTAYLNNIAVLKSFGIKKVYGITCPPFNQPSRYLHTAVTGGTSTSVVVEDTALGAWAVGGSYSTTASAATNIGTGAFLTGTGVLPVTSIAGASSGVVAIGTLGVLSYTGATATQLNGCQLIQGAGGTTVAGTTTVKNTSIVGIEIGGGANPLFETFYPSAAAYASNLVTLTVGGAATVTSSHVVGVLVMQQPEMLRQAYNGWLRTCPPALSGVFDAAALVEGPVYGGSPQGNVNYASASFNSSWHPYFGAVGTTDVHPMGPAFHTVLSNALSTFLHGTG